jgi:UDP-GlcNAc:undecaprenyl-phosphate GlcNAc-1-phosphate transferase
VNTYFALFLISIFAALIITPLIRRVCQRFQLFDVPVDGRRVHTRAIPRLGGVAIYLTCLLTLSALPFVDNLLTQTLRQYTSEVFIVLIPGTLVLLLGVYDDLRGTNATVKFIVLGLIAALFYAMGGRIEALSVPFIGSVHLPAFVSFVVTVFWLVGIANAFNLIDGMDGLATGAALFSSLVILAISFAQGHPVMIVSALVLCGALAGFLRYNFNPASIFLGDSGALFVGFSLAALSVLESRKATTAVAVVIPILAFGLPVVDTGVTIVRRLISRNPVFKGDNEHIHHMLLARGWSQQQVALILYAACAAFGLVAILFTNAGARLIGLALFVVAVVTIIAVGQLRYHEVAELRAGVKRTVGDRRIRVANNIRVRRASLALSKAPNLHELFEALALMLEFEEFAYANVQLGQPGRTQINERAFNASDRSAQLLKFRNGRILWSWNRNGVQEEDIVGSSAFWCLRLPLSAGNIDLGWINLYRPFSSPPLLLDMNYLSGFLRTDLTEAARRILESYEKPVGTGNVAMPMTAGKLAS